MSPDGDFFSTATGVLCGTCGRKHLTGYRLDPDTGGAECFNCALHPSDPTADEKVERLIEIVEGLRERSALENRPAPMPPVSLRKFGGGPRMMKMPTTRAPIDMSGSETT